MNWKLSRYKLVDVDVVTLNDDYGFLATVPLSRIPPGELRDALEKSGSVEVEVRVKACVTGG